ncbi:sensor domain-containing diguanylate cyclase [Kangiella sediminilitoris]|uniref:diguanylate cyclase n=1 Tax=Kangiella sediminilitoris TaxID=1144748 RepID=A0A1B3BAG5_9GAMM|nr:diguanylate cyclase [Kangiella sediminilitoris]AOE49789.1 hypothetical protein KS2013_1069 [Kangiella sediminilitoris]
MIGRLHYATIAISIILVAILSAVSLIFSKDKLTPSQTSFHKINLNQNIPPPPIFQSIKNLDSLIDGNDPEKVLNILYKISYTDRLPENPLLVVNPGHLSRATLYSLTDNGLQKVATKSRYDFRRAPEFMGHAKTFDLSLYKDQNLYLNITHDRETEPTLAVWSYAAYNRVDNQYNQLFTAIFFGIFLLLLVNSFFYLIFKRKEYLLYIFYNSCFLLFLMSSSGYIYQFPALSLLANNKNILFAIFTLSLYALYNFSQEFMSTQEEAPAEHKVINAFKYSYITLFVLSFILIPIPQLLVQLTNLLVVLAVPLYVWMVAKLLYKGNRQAFFFALAFALLIITAVLRVLTTFSILPEKFIFNHGFAVASLLEATIFTLGLADRVLQLKHQRDSAQKESIERSQAYELQKDFSTLLNRITTKLHSSESSEYENIIVKDFLTELREKLNFNSAAAIYQLDSKLHVYTEKDHEKAKYSRVIRHNGLQISRLCNIGHPQKLESTSPYQNMFVIPVLMRSHEWSCLILEVPENFHPTDSMLDFLQHYATELIRCLLNTESLRSIKDKAETDALTNLMNRGAILHRLESNFNLAKKSSQQLAIAFVDIDDFKQVNDTFGHAAGDLCLKTLANLFLEELPSTCLIGRYGGDEFLVIFPDTSVDIAKNYLSNVSERIIPLIVENRSCRYTLSIGISGLTNETKDTLHLIREADKALYVSKHGGKAQINLAK